MIDMSYDILKEAYQGMLVYEKVLRAENATLRDWIRSEGERTDICTFHILGCEICNNCRCERGNGRTKAP